MLKITTYATAACVTLKLEGKLLQPWLPDLRDAYERARAAAPALGLDLADVTFVDAAGALALGEMLRDGALLGDCSSFVAELLQVGQP